MKAEIIHDPTRGWLLLTEKWPGGEFPETMDNINLFLVHRNSCLSTAIEIQREDWDAIDKLVRNSVGQIDANDTRTISVRGKYVDGDFEWNDVPIGGRCSVCLKTRQEQSHGCSEITCPKGRPIQDHHPYSVDAEFEVRGQYTS